MDTLPHPSIIAAIIPCYRDSGDCTAILTTDGAETALARSVHSVLRRLARQLATDLAALKANTCTITQRSILQILPLSARLVLVPVKVRKPRLSGDSTIGYINFYAIESVGPACRRESKACVKLTDGREVAVMWTAATVNKYLQSARLVVSQYQQPPTGILRESSAVYTPEATKIIVKLIELFQDIAALKLLKN